MGFRMRRVAVLLVLLLGAMACQSEEEKLTGLLTRADALLAQERWAEAEREYGDALRVDPNSAAAHYGLAKSHLGRKQVRRAFWELEETVRLDPSNLEARQRHGELLLFGSTDELERAVESADAILAVDPSRWQALLLRGRALDALERPDEAGVAFADAAEAAPDEPAAVLLFANHLRRVGQTEAAEASFRHLTKVHPRFASWAALGAFLSSEDRNDEAEQAFREGVAAAEPEERTTATSALSNFLLGRGRTEDAEQVLRESLEAEPDNVELIYALARFYHSAGRTADADAMIEQATRANPEDLQPLLLLSSYRGRIGDLEGALEAAEQALAVAPENVLARLRRAEVLVDLGLRDGDDAKIATGKGVVDAVLAAEPSSPEGLFVSAKVDLARQRFPEAIASLRRAVDGRSDWAQAHFLLGTALFLSGDAAGARSEVARAIELDVANVDAHKVLARIHARLGDHALAVEAGERALAATPGDVGTRILVAQSLVNERRLDEALGRLLAIDEEERGVAGNFAIGRVYAFRQEYDNARKYLMLALEMRPAHPEVLTALAQIDAREGRLGESLERVGAARDADPNDAALQVLYGDLAAAAGDRAAAEAAFQRAIELDANHLEAYAKLARLLLGSGRGNEAIATYQQALERNPRSGSLHLLLASLFEAGGRLEEAMEHYNAAIEIDPELAVAKNNLAYLMAERGRDLDRALELAQEAKAAMPDNPNAADTLGWVLYKKDLPAAAIGYLREAIGGFETGDPNLPLVRHHLALAYEANEDRERAVQALEKAVSELDALGGARAERAEPVWAEDIRSQLERLRERG
jgi:tetratricopeptide (TPR) repeat protein